MTGVARHLQSGVLALGLAVALAACSSSEPRTAAAPAVSNETLEKISAAADRAAEAADRAIGAAERAESAAGAAAEAAEKSNRIAQQGLRK